MVQMPAAALCPAHVLCLLLSEQDGTGSSGCVTGATKAKTFISEVSLAF